MEAVVGPPVLFLLFLETCDAYMKKTNVSKITEWNDVTLIWHRLIEQLQLKRDHLAHRSSAALHATEWIPSEYLNDILKLEKENAKTLWQVIVGSDASHETFLSVLSQYRAERISALKYRLKNPPSL